LFIQKKDKDKGEFVNVKKNVKNDVVKVEKNIKDVEELTLNKLRSDNVIKTKAKNKVIYNIRTLSVNIKFICTSFRNRQNSEPSARQVCNWY
jgi:hypothetical protein